MRTAPAKFVFPCALLIVSAVLAKESDAPQSDSQDDLKRKTYDSILREDEAGFARKKPPRPGEWLATHPEPAETLGRYMFLPHVRPTAARRTIVLQPLGALNDEQKQLLEKLREYTEIFFQLPARIEKPIALDETDKSLTRKVVMPLRRDGYETQFNADTILQNILVKKVPQDAVAFLGITMQDLYSGNFNYVFGIGSMNERAGVYSLRRYFPEFWNQKRNANSEKLALLRSCKVLTHETGHMFGLPHCVFYECSMNGSNSLPETDAAPVHFCPVCHRKLMWNIDFNPNKRFAELEVFYKKNSLDTEAAFIADRAKNWKKVEDLEKLRKQGDE